MGSVTTIYTTGDNDPELEPTQYLRHYLYCDACGSFDFETWHGSPATGVVARGRLRTAALAVVPAALAAGWVALGIGWPPTVPAWLLVGLAYWALGVTIIRRYIWGAGGSTVGPWRALKWALAVLVSTGVGEWLALSSGSAPMVLAATATFVVSLLVASRLVGSDDGDPGVLCRGCRAVYPRGGPLFCDLESNPRNLGVADVPRPLGTSLFVEGRSMSSESPSPQPPSRLPT